MRVGSCSETACNVLNRAYDNPLESEEHAAMPFAGGILQHGYQCGLLWGATLAAGAEAYRRFGAGPRAEAAAVHASKALVETFRSKYGHINCAELIETDWHNTAQVVKYFLKGGSFRCLRLAGKYASIARDVIEHALAEEDIPIPEGPVSCAAETARRMGATDEQVVMAAGLAGGIGLSGSACGAMGAAIWVATLKRMETEEGKIDYKDPRVHAQVESFLQVSDYRFECSDITGGHFAQITDHADHVSTGECKAILDSLAQYTAEAEAGNTGRVGDFAPA